MDKLKIEYVDINNIKPYSKNAKRHPKKQIQKIYDESPVEIIGLIIYKIINR